MAGCDCTKKAARSTRSLAITIWKSTSIEYIAAAGIGHDRNGPLFRTAAGKTGELTQNKMWQQDAYAMIQRRAAAAGIKTRIGNHTFRATGITAYLKNKGTLEAAQHIANHESPRDDEAL